MSSNQSTLINNGTEWGRIFQASSSEPHLIGTMVKVTPHQGLVAIRPAQLGAKPVRKK